MGNLQGLNEPFTPVKHLYEIFCLELFYYAELLALLPFGNKSENLRRRMR